MISNDEDLELFLDELLQLLRKYNYIISTFALVKLFPGIVYESWFNAENDKFTMNIKEETNELGQ